MLVPDSSSASVKSWTKLLSLAQLIHLGYFTSTTWWRVGWWRGGSLVARWLVARFPGGEMTGYQQNLFQTCCGPQLSHQNQMFTANYKSLTSNSNHSQQIQIAHSKFKSLTANSNRSQRITNHSQQITNRSQQIQIAHSKLKAFTAN